MYVQRSLVLLLLFYPTLQFLEKALDFFAARDLPKENVQAGRSRHPTASTAATVVSSRKFTTKQDTVA
eukprot:5032081-Pleurochrysis_carterae.AAC.3